MKLLAKLEKNKIFWYLLGLSLIFFLLRLPSLIEPNWYGDEGIYQVVGLAISKGRLLYSQIWDNKPPLLYIVYAIFNGDQFRVRLFSMLSGLFATWTFFYLAQSIFKQLKASVISTLFFVLIFATPILEGNIANAENFMLLLTILSGLLVYKISAKRQTRNSKTKKLIGVGLILGIAFMFKIVAIFDLGAFLVYLIIFNIKEFKIKNTELWSKKDQLLPLVINVCFVLLGFLIPLFATSIFFISKHAFSDFTTAVFFSNVGYVGYGNKLLIPQGFLILKLLMLTSAVSFIFWKRKVIDNVSIFTIVWLSFSIFNTFFSGRPYTHYALVTLPAFCLLVGLLIVAKKQREKVIYLIILLSTAILLYNTFKPNFNKSIRYYPNAISFLMNKQNVVSYQSFFDQKTPRDYEIASFIKTHTKPSDNIFIWGDSAQIYALSGKLPPGKYTVAYHIEQYKSGLEQTQSALNLIQPKYIVSLPESAVFPFRLSTYSSKFVFKGVVIYERDF